MKRAIITGTKGFIGKNLLEEIKNDFQVFEINEDIFDIDNWVDVLNGILDDVNPDVIFHTNSTYPKEKNFS